jgi:hypothetical protein
MLSFVVIVGDDDRQSSQRRDPTFCAETQQSLTTDPTVRGPEPFISVHSRQPDRLDLHFVIFRQPASPRMTSNNIICLHGGF